MELSTELKVSKKNRSSTEVESFEELNLSYTINLYIPAMTNTQQQVHDLGCFSSWRYHTAMGISSCVPGLALAEVICPCYTCLEPDKNNQPVAHVLNLTSLTSLWRNEEWMIKASQEKQVFMCTSTKKKKTSLSSTKCILRGKKTINRWQKLPQIGTQFVEHRQNKNQTKTQETSPQKKSTACIPVLFGNFCSL